MWTVSIHRYVLLHILEVNMAIFNILLYHINAKQQYVNMKNAITSLNIHTYINTDAKDRTPLMN